MSKGKEVVAEIEAAAAAAVESSTEKKLLLLKSSDGEKFEVEESVAVMGSSLIKGMVEDGCTDGSLTLHSITGRVLAKIIEYWQRHAGSGSNDESLAELVRWDAQFMEIEGKTMMLNMLMAANYLEAQPLFDLFCQAIADGIKDMSVEDVRRYFDIVNDFTPEEEDKLRHDYSCRFGE